MENQAVRLRRLRGDRSLEEFARILGVTVSSLRAYEAGKRRPRDEIQARIRRLQGSRP